MWQDIKDAFTEVVTDIIDFIPNLLAAIVLLLVGMYVAKFAARLTHRLLKALKFDELVDKSGLGAFVERAGWADSGLLLARLVGWIITLIFVQLAAQALGIESVEQLVNTFVEWIPNVIVAIVLIVVTGAAANFAHSALVPTLSNVNAGDLVLKVIVVAIWVIGGFAAIDQLGFGRDIVDQLWFALTTGLAAIFVIKFGVGGIWAARDRFWPKVYDAIESAEKPAE
jgi:hypothetical protein